MALEIFTSLRSDVFPDGASILPYRQGEAFSREIAGSRAGDFLDLSSGIVAVTCEWYTGNVRVSSTAGERPSISIKNMVKSPADVIASPFDLHVRLAGTLRLVDFPADLYPPEVALNEVNKVPVAVSEPNTPLSLIHI